MYSFTLRFLVFIGLIASSVVLQVASVMTVWNHMQPEYAANMWNEALNKRLGTQVSD
jgi:hypothetical protein